MCKLGPAQDRQARSGADGCPNRGGHAPPCRAKSAQGIALGIVTGIAPNTGFAEEALEGTALGIVQGTAPGSDLGTAHDGSLQLAGSDPHSVESPDFYRSHHQGNRKSLSNRTWICNTESQLPE